RIRPVDRCAHGERCRSAQHHQRGRSERRPRRRAPRTGRSRPCDRAGLSGSVPNAVDGHTMTRLRVVVTAVATLVVALVAACCPPAVSQATTGDEPTTWRAHGSETTAI